MQPIPVNSIGELPATAKKILEAFPDTKLFAFYGAMGAGKTSLIKAICLQLGVTENTSSPTFAIVNEYHSAKDTRIFHFDFYRMEKLTEAFDIGFEEYLDSGSPCLIEWPEKVEVLLPPDTVRLRIDVTGDLRVISEVK